MVQLQILSGQGAGTAHFVKRFPFLVGRAARAGLRLEDQGVWDEHFRLELRPDHTFALNVLSEALVALNGQYVQSATLKNSDIIQAGAVRLQFWLAPTRQRGLRVRELVVWIGLIVLCLGQILLIYYLLR